MFPRQAVAVVEREQVNIDLNEVTDLNGHTTIAFGGSPLSSVVLCSSLFH
jgi:hypothetical protein